MHTRPRILQISLSPIERDARVLRQLSVLADFGDVTTVGYGGRPADAADHVAVPEGLSTLPQTVTGVARLAVRAHSSVELAAPAVQYALGALDGTSWDLVVANEARALPLAFELAGGSPVWGDMHEWAPEERTHILSWRLLVAPFMTHVCRDYLPRCGAVTTVAGSIADLYERDFGVRTEVMRNSTHLRDLRPSDVGDTVRLVHSGAAVRGRNLEATIDVARELGPGFPLDFYLVAANDNGKYLGELRERAEGCPWITFRDPVRPDDLPATLNTYDVGVFWIPPTSMNARLTLPNKFFDYVQARLALAIGPSIEMERLVEASGLGFVSTDFSVEACVASLRDVTPEHIAAAKRASDAAAQELSFEQDAQVARDIVTRLLDRSA